MSKDDKNLTPDENVAAENVAAETVSGAGAANAHKTVTMRVGTVIGIGAAGLAVIVGAGIGGAAIAHAADHRGFDREHSMFDRNGGQFGGRVPMGGRGQNGQNGQLPNGGQMPNGQNMPVPGATSGTNGQVTPQNLQQAPTQQQGTSPQAYVGNQAPHGFTGGS